MNGSVKRSYNQDVEDDMPVLDKMEEGKCVLYNYLLGCVYLYVCSFL